MNAERELTKESRRYRLNLVLMREAGSVVVAETVFRLVDHSPVCGIDAQVSAQVNFVVPSRFGSGH